MGIFRSERSTSFNCWTARIPRQSIMLLKISLTAMQPNFREDSELADAPLLSEPTHEQLLSDSPDR